MPTHDAKTCNSCTREQKLNEFAFRKDRGYHYSICRTCARERSKEYRACHLDKIRESRALLRKSHPERLAAYQKKSRTKLKTKVALKERSYRKQNAEKIRIRKKLYHKQHKRKFSELTAKRRLTDISFRIAGNLRNRLKAVFRGRSKTGSAVRDLGCSKDALIQHLESKFQAGMTWNNYGNKRDQWSIDHIKPLSLFDLTDPNQVKIACHYLNLQPLWHVDNMSKGARYAPVSL